jgi:hypothetical protein
VTERLHGDPSQYTLTFDVAFSGKDLLHARIAGLRR